MDSKIRYLFLAVVLFLSTMARGQDFNPDDPAEPTEPVAPPVSLVLKASPAEGGTVSGAGKYSVGAEVTINATANNGFVFVNWTDANGNVLATTRQYTHTKGARVETITANFRFQPGSPSEPDEPGIRPKHYITVTAGEGGTATSSSNRVMEGESVTITATPNSGYNFTGWYQADTLVTTAAKYTFTMGTADVNFAAMFEKAPVAPFNPSSPSEPNAPSVAKNSLYLLTVAAKPGDTANCVVYFNAVKPVSNMTFQLGFPSGTTPLPDSLKVSDRASGYEVTHTMVNDSTVAVNLTGDTLNVGNIKLLTLSLKIPEDYPTGIGNVITVSQVSVTNLDETTETASTRNSSLDVYKFGDADNSGEIDIVDLAMARDYLYGVHVDGFEPVAVDLNRNGRVDTDDIKILTQLILNR